jgi:hypothetical protein
MENRRQHHEREAAMTLPEKDPHWERLLPILDGALETLGQAELAWPSNKRNARWSRGN